MTSNLKIRRPTPSGTPWLLELFAEAVPGREFLPSELLLMQEQAQRNQWTQRWGSEGESIVDLGGVPAARVWVARTPQTLRVIELCVAAEFRHQGLGRRILGDLCRAADAAGWDIELTVDSENAVACHLYESLGFQTWNNPAGQNGFSLGVKRTPQETASH